MVRVGVRERGRVRVRVRVRVEVQYPIIAWACCFRPDSAGRRPLCSSFVHLYLMQPGTAFWGRSPISLSNTSFALALLLMISSPCGKGEGWGWG